MPELVTTNPGGTSLASAGCANPKSRLTLVGAVHLFLLRKQPHLRPEILMLRRHNTGYEDGNYSVPAGHIDPGESATAAMVREATEEIDITLDPHDLRMAHVMHRRNVGVDCSNSERVDFFFVSRRWTGDPVNREPHKCDDLSWFSVSAFPENTIPYISAAIVYLMAEEPYSELGWESRCPQCGNK